MGQPLWVGLAYARACRAGFVDCLLQLRIVVQLRRKSADGREESGLPSLSGSGAASVAGEACNRIASAASSPSGMALTDAPTCEVDWSALKSLEMLFTLPPLSAMTPLPSAMWSPMTNTPNSLSAMTPLPSAIWSPMTNTPNSPLSPVPMECHFDRLRAPPSTPPAVLCAGGIEESGR